eukprot:5927441-Amphidinium_carterae.1
MDAPDETVNVQDEPPKKKIHRRGKRQHRAHRCITPEMDRQQVKQRDPSPSPDGSNGHGTAQYAIKCLMQIAL